MSNINNAIQLEMKIDTPKNKRIIPMLKFVELVKQFQGRKVEVYYNLHKKVYSIRCLKSKLVIAHCNDVIPLIDVSFKVSEKGRQRVLREKRKNVHAFVRGTISHFHNMTDSTTYSVKYDPYRFDSFMASLFESFKPWTKISNAPACVMIIQSKTNKPFIHAYDDKREGI